MGLPIRYRLRNLGAWISDVTGLQVMQPDTGLARPDLPYIGLSRLPGSWDGSQPRREVRLDVPTSWTLDFSGVIAAEYASAQIAQESIEVFGVAGAAARDACLTAFAETWLSADGWITATASGAAGVALASGSGWVPPSVGVGLQVGLTVDSTADLVCYETPVELLYRLQVFGAEYPEDVLSSLKRAAQWAAPDGLRFAGPPSTTSIQSGADREIRGWVDLRVGLDRLDAEAAVGLASVGVTLPLVAP